MDYNQSLQTLEELTTFGINLGLGRIVSLLSHFGSPQNRVPAVHIGGTNGKGSTTAMMASVLQKAGYKVGVYTSPHLISYTERIVINGRPIKEQEFADLMEELHSSFQEVKKETGENPTEFEVLTALAWIYFDRAKVDLALLEVGMGGDLDSTNAVKSPLLSVITNVSVDHAQYLGATIPEIAQRKSGIIKAKRPVVTASSHPEALEVIRDRAARSQAPLYIVQEHMKWQRKEESAEGQTFLLQSRRENYGELLLPLWGGHQLVNAATAVLGLEILADMGLKVNRDSIRAGLIDVRWPGRLQVLSRDPLLVVDGAHNPEGMECLAGWLAEKSRQVNGVVLVIGMLADKDQEHSVQYLKPFVDEVIITKPLSPRAGDWRRLGRLFEGVGSIAYEEDVTCAVQKAREKVKPGGMALVTGSLYLIGEILRHFDKQRHPADNNIG